MLSLSDDMFDFFDEEPAEQPLKEVTEEQKKAAEEELREYLKRKDDEEDLQPRKKLKYNQFEKIHIEDKIPDIKVHIIDVESCRHEVAIPEGSNYAPLVKPKTKPPKKYKFKLDTFQEQAVLCIENSQSVLVSAHTSAGKTVVAEYAIALCLKNNQRVIYTTPIKALSNQKFRDFHAEFEDVGLMTGDVTINENASCLVMTTEILRSMLFKGAEIVNEVGWVIFDEVHYMRDKERGYVWEETLILLKSSVHFVFLSATIQNAAQFAQWICYVHKQPCHVVYTEYRPVPLQHNIAPGGSGKWYSVVDKSGKIDENNLKRALAAAEKAPESEKKTGFKGGVVQEGKNDMLRLIKSIHGKMQLPVVVFSFSKRQCEEYAKQVFSFGLLSTSQSNEVEEIFNRAMEALSEEDRQLPGVTQIFPYLKKGIGIHHGGLLPIVKELVEILFTAEYINVLFATETFAMGLNMPARTVAFTGLKKFDGAVTRYVTPSEYVQMSGRAGRRGMDSEGTVVIKINEAMNSEVAKNLLKGKTDPLNSSFHLTFNMVLNLLRLEEYNAEYIIERSFYYFQNFPKIPEQQKKIIECQKEIKKIRIEDEMSIKTYCNIKADLENLLKEKQRLYLKSPKLTAVLKPGRIILVKTKNHNFGWGVLISVPKKTKQMPNLCPSDVLKVVLAAEKHDGIEKNINQLKPGEDYVYSVNITINEIWDISQRLVTPLPGDLGPNGLRLIRDQMKKKIKLSTFQVHPETHLGLVNTKVMEVIDNIAILTRKREKHSLYGNPDVEKMAELFNNKEKLRDTLSHEEADLIKARSALHVDELKSRMRVLRRLGYITTTDTIERKGRVACELSSGDPLLLTELLFNGVFNNLDVPETCSLLSVFVCNEKNDSIPDVNNNLTGSFTLLQDTARRIAKVCNECRLDTNEDEYISQFKPNFMKLVYDWCCEASFQEICKSTPTFEGSIVRSVRRLEELLREMSAACKVVGMDMDKKFDNGIAQIKRGIMFTASLYL